MSLSESLQYQYGPEQTALAEIVYESARKWREANPDRLPSTWSAGEWTRDGKHKSRKVVNHKGQHFTQHRYSDGSGEIVRQKYDIPTGDISWETQ